MEYAQHTWRLPLPCTQSNLPPRATSHGVATTTSGNSFVDPGNSFNILDEINDVATEGYVPDYLNQDWIEGRFHQRYELMLKRRKMAEVYHTSHGHCNNRQTVSNLQAKGIENNHLKRYILAHKCDACDAAPGRHHHKVRTTTKAKRKARSASNTIASLPATVAACDLQNSLADDCDLNLELSTITDAIDPNVTITESLARFFQHTSNNPCDYIDIDRMHNMSDNTQEPTQNAAMLPPRAFSDNSTVIDDGANLKTNTAPRFSPPGTDLRMD